MLFRQLLVGLGYQVVASTFPKPRSVVKILDDFLDRVCFKDVLERLDINCVLDVGAHDGSFTHNLRRIGYEGLVRCFEPNPDLFRNLTARYKYDARISVFDCALGDCDGTKTFYVTSQSNLGSLLAPRFASVEDVIQVQVRRLDSMFTQLIAPLKNARVLLKIDTQGYDLEVVKGAGGCIDDICAIQSEISVQPIYENMPHFTESLEFYESLGFRLFDLFEVSRDNLIGNIVEYDCLMARPELFRAHRS
jgi:FkbM family methyltransferase